MAEKQKKIKKCVLCGEGIETDMNGWREGHNPYPLSKEGRCCEACNFARVIPARMGKLGLGVVS